MTEGKQGRLPTLTLGQLPPSAAVAALHAFSNLSTAPLLGCPG